MKRILTALSLFSGLIGIAQPGSGSLEDSLKAKQLGEVVITGQYLPQSIRQSVYQVRVINSERIRLSGALNVQQVLVNQLGLRFSNDNTLGTTDIQLMGMSGRNVKILMDGVPLVDRGDTRESLGQIDVNTIDRIEIVEGPMSVSYGSDALAGVINIITKKSLKDNLTVTARAQEETAGDEYHPFSYKGSHNQFVEVGWQKKGWNLTVGGSHNDFDGFGGDQYGRQKTWKPKEQWLGHARIGYRTNGFGIYYRIDELDEEIVSRGKMGQTYTAIDQRYLSDRMMHQLQSNWHLSERFQWNNIVSFTNYKRRTRTTQHDFTTGNDVLTTGAGEQDLSKFNSFVFRSTVHYKLSSMVSLQQGIDINRESASGERIDGKPDITDYALFVSAEIKPVERLNIRPGLRFMKNSVYDAPPVIPSLNSKINLSKQSELRLAYAYGFRAPALRELYFDYHDANHDIIGNTDLKAEHSNSFTGSWTWTPALKKSLQFSTIVSGFYSDFRNLIDFAVDPSNATQFKAVNIDRFKTTGGTIENAITYNNLKATLGFSYIGRFNELSGDEVLKSEDLPDFVWSPEINSNIIYTIPKLLANVSLFYKFTGNRPGYELRTNETNGNDEVHRTKISSFNWADLTLSKRICNLFTVNLGIKNIFDVTDVRNSSTDPGGAHSESGAIATSYGRSYFLGLNFQWTKNQ